MRLLDLVASALEATTNGAQARIQLELVLIKAAAPERDPTTSALLARIERLEAGRTAARAAGATTGDRPPPQTVPEHGLAASGGGGGSTGPRTSSEPEPDPEPEPRAGDLAPVAEMLARDRGHPCGRRWSRRVKQGNAMLAALLADARAVCPSTSGS